LSPDITKLLKLSLTALSFGYFDHALMILERPEDAKFLGTEFNKTFFEIVASASRVYSRKAFFREFYR